jgi:hypothetical protein
MNASFLQLLMANSHNKLRKIVRITSKHISFYLATIPKVNQI